MEYRDEERNPWPWVAIVVGILIFLGASWWVASAATRGDDIVLTEEQQRQPSQQPQEDQQAEQPASEQPTATEQQPPVNIYVERTPQQPEQPPVVIIVPQDEQPPRASEGTELSRVELPARFTYRGSTWTASDHDASPNRDDLTNTGASIDGRAIYVKNDDDPPYDAVYVETERNSGVFVRYTRR